MEKTEKQTKGLRRFLWILPLLGLLFLAAAVWAVSTRYTVQFLPGTRLLGVECGNMSPEQAAGELRAAADRAELVLGDTSGVEIARLKVGDFIDDGALDAAAREAFARQRQSAKWYDWLLEADRRYASAPMAGLSERDVRTRLQTLLYADEGYISPKNAFVELTDTGYTVVEAQQGNLINMGVCASALAKALGGLEDLSGDPPAVILDGAAVLPKVTSGSEEILRVTAELDEYLGQSVTLDFENGHVYTLSGEEIRSVSDISIQSRGVDCHPDPERLRELMERVITDNGSDGVFAKFRHVEETRPYVYYRVFDTGWIMDRDKLTSEVAAALESRQGGTFTPTYDYTWYWKSEYKNQRVGDTYIEISLDNQYMWCYLDGKLLVETPIVTGDLAKRNNTRRGCFKIFYKTTDTILRGPTWNDHVDYWMPFDGGIGLHDSAWRDEYGEDIYMTDGSHGCINTPLEAMRIIYENYKVNDFVIVY